MRSWKSIVFVLPLIGFSALAYWLHQIVPNFALVERSSSEVVDTLYGWEIVSTSVLWPFLSISFALGFVVAVIYEHFAMAPAFEQDAKTLKDDHERKIKILRENLSSAEQAKDEAIAQARKSARLELEQQQAAVEKRQAQAQALERLAKEKIEKAEREVDSMRTTLQQERAARIEAQRRGRNAIMTLKRKEAKFKKISVP